MRSKNEGKGLTDRREYFEVHCTTLEKTELQYRAARLGETIGEYVLSMSLGPNGVCGAGGGRYDEELIRTLKGLTIEEKKERRREARQAIAEARKAARQKEKAAKLKRAAYRKKKQQQKPSQSTKKTKGSK